MGELFWQYNSLDTHIFFELQSIMIFSPVANFGNQPLGGHCTIFRKFQINNYILQSGLYFVNLKSQLVLLEICDPIYFQNQLAQLLCKKEAAMEKTWVQTNRFDTSYTKNCISVEGVKQFFNPIPTCNGLNQPIYVQL